MTATLAPPEPAVEELESALFDDEELARLLAPPAARPRRSWLRRHYDVLARAVIVGWPAFILFLALFEPVSTGIPRPLWVDIASAAILIGLPILAFTGSAFPTPAFLGSALLGGLGIAVGIACRATAHHLGPWWIVETAGFGAITALSIACVTARVRR
jgi:hypothetical protein